MGVFCLVVEFHWRGCAVNGATGLVFKTQPELYFSCFLMPEYSIKKTILKLVSTVVISWYIFLVMPDLLPFSIDSLISGWIGLG